MCTKNKSLDQVCNLRTIGNEIGLYLRFILNGFFFMYVIIEIELGPWTCKASPSSLSYISIPCQKFLFWDWIFFSCSARPWCCNPPTLLRVGRLQACITISSLDFNYSCHKSKNNNNNKLYEVMETIFLHTAKHFAIYMYDTSVVFFSIIYFNKCWLLKHLKSIRHFSGDQN